MIVVAESEKTEVEGYKRKINIHRKCHQGPWRTLVVRSDVKSNAILTIFNYSVRVVKPPSSVIILLCCIVLPHFLLVHS